MPGAMTKWLSIRTLTGGALLTLALAAGAAAPADAGHRTGHKAGTTQRTLSVSVSGAGNVTGPGIACPGDCSQSYADGTTVTLSATPSSGASFSGWSGACTGAGSCAVAMTTGRSALATFAAAPTEPPPDDGDDASACGWGTFDATNQPGACWRPYSDSSPFNVGTGTAPRQASNSAPIVTRTLGFGTAGTRGGPLFTGGVADTTSDYDHPLYYSKPTDPLYTIRCRKWISACTVDGMQVRIPAQARPAGGSDAHLAVIDQAAGREYGFWETESLPAGGGTLYIGHGGYTPIGTSGALGIGSSSLSNAVTAAHFGLAAGVVRPEELAAGQINHALFMVVKCTNGTYVWPARGPGVGRTCSSMGLSNADAPALGQHFYLDMTDAEISALPIPTWKKTILRAMARYGMFVGDTGATTLGWSIVVQSGSSYTSFGQADPWVSLAKQYGIASYSGKYYFDLKDTIDWKSKLRVADPCVSRKTC